MKATKHEMAFVKLTRKDVHDLIKFAISAKYPHLFNDLKWEWEELYFSKDINSPTAKDEDEAAHCTFAKREEELQTPVDKAPKVVYVAVNEVCR